jgi:hypothetical protein
LNHSTPSADAYANERVRFAPLPVVDIGGESAAVSFLELLLVLRGREILGSLHVLPEQ